MRLISLDTHADANAFFDRKTQSRSQPSRAYDYRETAAPQATPLGLWTQDAPEVGRADETRRYRCALRSLVPEVTTSGTVNGKATRLLRRRSGAQFVEPVEGNA